ncbi:hypothetical protein CLIB1423_06S06810 [[Candida] railenensis]|uniref:RNA polymerase II elongation factor ELL N-terminal domain-containing protein n=1 Tax=[Candida] railenensis TaxID=45579 RepID=A0A9P0QPD3_9ASCO|nr:hypothetical protein CLIB1423_06S06810 [[Candida] railenensis]
MATISSLHPVPSRLQEPAPISIKLNAEIINQLKQCKSSGIKAKLIVKDGQYSIKIDKSEYPCSALPETSRIDVYDGGADYDLDYKFKGRISTRLNVLTDPKMIKEYFKRPPTSTSSHFNTPIPTPTSTPTPKLGPGSSVLTAPNTVKQLNTTSPTLYASNEDGLSKFLYFAALGPVSIKTLCQSLKLSEKEVSSFLSQYSQVYNPNDSFIIDDIFSRNEGENGSQTSYILKDKSYKELKPWDWAYYTDDERSLIIHNIHNALTRLGFSETHPLRRKLTERRSSSVEADDDSNSPIKKSSSLGGGMLKQRKVSPVKRSQTSSPRPPVTQAESTNNNNNSNNNENNNDNSIEHTNSNGNNSTSFSKNSNVSPLKEKAFKRKLSLSSASSSDDEKPLGSVIASDKNSSVGYKRRRTVGRGRTSSNSSSGSGGSSTSMNSIGNGGDNYTSPSSINEESENEPSPPAIPQLSSTPARLQTANSSTQLFSFQEPSKEQKKLQFYNNLALKFKVRYKEYEELYKTLQLTSSSSSTLSASTPTINGNSDKKRNITKLFELHNQLAEWKRKLWDFDNESKTKSKIMTLQKHKKNLSDGTGKSQSLSPSIPQSQIVSSHTSVPVQMKKRAEPPKLPMKPTAFNRSLDY